MQPTYPETESFRTYAQPLSGLQVSWGSILAGTLTTLAISLILWALALAIIMTVMDANIGDIRGGILAMWICGIITTLIGAFVGGAVAGYLPGNARRFIGGTHALLSWALAFLVATTVQFGILRSITRTAATSVTSVAGTALQTAGTAVSGPETPRQNLIDVLTSLGYSRSQANDFVRGLQTQIQQVLGGGGAQQAGVARTVQSGADTFLNWMAGLSWAWFGTWFVALGLALLGGFASARRLRFSGVGARVPVRRTEVPLTEQRPYTTPPTPQPV